MSLGLVLTASVHEQRALHRGLNVAVVPVIATTAYLTYSRTSIGSVAILWRSCWSALAGDCERHPGATPATGTDGERRSANARGDPGGPGVDEDAVRPAAARPHPRDGPTALRTRPSAATEDPIQIDYLYAANWSAWGDVKIMMRTVVYMLRRRGA